MIDDAPQPEAVHAEPAPGGSAAHPSSLGFVPRGPRWAMLGIVVLVVVLLGSVLAFGLTRDPTVRRPVVIGQQITAGTPQVAMYAFAVFYAFCLVLNWWFYLRTNAYVKNP